MPSALHSAKTAMVFPCKKRSAAEVFRPVSQQQNRSFVMRDPQGLRRPRFSFFIFTCQTARDPKNPNSRSLLPTTNNNRQLSAADSLIVVRSFKGTTPCLDLGQDSAAPEWAGYRPAQRTLSTVLSTNRRNICKPTFWRITPDFSGFNAVLEPHSCDVLLMKYATKGQLQV